MWRIRQAIFNQPERSVASGNHTNRRLQFAAYFLLYLLPTISHDFQLHVSYRKNIALNNNSQSHYALANMLSPSDKLPRGEGQLGVKSVLPYVWKNWC